MGKILPRAWLLLLLAPALWLASVLAGPGGIHAAPGATYTDLAVTHLPNAEFLRQTLADQGELPLWNPHILGGTPFAGDPLSGMYYPPLWLAALLSPALAFNLLFLMHLMLAGIGAYRLARSEGIPPTGALLAGIAFGGMPNLIAHAAAGHLTLLLAAAWTPWLLLATGKAARGSGLRRWAGAGALAGVVCLADPRWAAPASLAALLFAVARNRRSAGAQSLAGRLLRAFLTLLVFAVFALGIAAVLLIPMAEFASLSTRASMQPADAMSLSLPPANLIGLLFAGAGGSAEWMLYPGAVVLVLAVVSCFLSSPFRFFRRPPREDGNPPGEGEKGDDGNRFWLLLFLVSLILSLGNNIPILSDLLARIPGLNLLRVPPRWMMIGGLSLSMLAGRGLAILAVDGAARTRAAKAAFGLTAAGLTVAIGAGMWHMPSPIWIGGAVYGAAGILLLAAFRYSAWTGRVAAGICLLAVLDLACADIPLVDAKSLTESADAVLAADYIRTQGEDFRIFSPSASIPQDLAIRDGLRLLDGVNPLMLKSTAQTVSLATNIPLNGYSVTLPPFAAGNPAADNASATPDWEQLGVMNVRFVAASFELPGITAGPMERIGDLYLYANPAAVRRAWVASDLETWKDPIAAAKAEDDGPNRMSIRTEGPGWLVVSEAAYPDWRAAVDGQPVEMATAGGWWRAVEIGPGEHLVTMWDEPISSWIGLAVTCISLAALAGVLRWVQ